MIQSVDTATSRAARFGYPQSSSQPVLIRKCSEHPKPHADIKPLPHADIKPRPHPWCGPKKTNWDPHPVPAQIIKGAPVPMPYNDPAAIDTSTPPICVMPIREPVPMPPICIMPVRSSDISDKEAYLYKLKCAGAYESTASLAADVQTAADSAPQSTAVDLAV